MDEEDGFNEVAWDRERQIKEAEVARAVEELMFFMGCNHITLPMINRTVVKIRPEGE